MATSLRPTGTPDRLESVLAKPVSVLFATMPYNKLLRTSTSYPMSHPPVRPLALLHKRHMCVQLRLLSLCTAAEGFNLYRADIDPDPFITKHSPPCFSGERVHGDWVTSEFFECYTLGYQQSSSFVFKQFYTSIHYRSTNHPPVVLASERTLSSTSSCL